MGRPDKAIHPRNEHNCPNLYHHRKPLAWMPLLRPSFSMTYQPLRYASFALLVAFALYRLQNLMRVSLPNYPAIKQSASAAGVDIVQDMSCMGDNKSGMSPVTYRMFFLQKFIYKLADKSNIYQVHTGFRLIQQNQGRVLSQQLQKLGAFYLPPGKSIVYLPVHEFRQIGSLCQTVYNLSTHPPFGTGSHHITSLYTTNNRRSLEGYTNTQTCSFVHRQPHYIPAPENNAAFGYLIFRRTHYGHNKSGLAATIRTEKHMRLTSFNAQIYVMQYLPVTYSYIQVFNLQHIIRLHLTLSLAAVQRMVFRFAKPSCRVDKILTIVNQCQKVSSLFSSQ